MELGRRIGVSGSSHGLGAAGVAVCRVVGELLARQSGLRLVFSGKHRRDLQVPLHDVAAEWHIAQAAQAVLQAHQEDGANRFTTFLAPEDEPDTCFRIGQERTPRGKSSESRRFAVINHADALITVGGGKGTRQELALAAERGIPILPLSLCADDAADDHWRRYGPELRHQLDADAKMAALGQGLEALPPEAAAERAGTLVARFLSRLPETCFVIMPFAGDHAPVMDRLIKPAVEAMGDVALRTDRSGLTGEVTRQIVDGLQRARYAIAVMDPPNLNVMYETGYAHALGKPVILLRNGAAPAEGLPFDIRGHQSIGFDLARPDAAVAAIEHVIRTLRNQRQ